MKLTKTTLTLALIAFGTASFAFPAHQQDGFRDTGCDEAARVEIRNDAGELLYVNNPTCGSAGGGAIDLASLQAAFPAPVEPEEALAK